MTFLDALDILITNNGDKLVGKYFSNGWQQTRLIQYYKNRRRWRRNSTTDAPSFAATGSSFSDVASSPSLQLSQFSVAAWFKTSADFSTDAVIVNKGGFGSETAGQNMNWGIWMNSAQQVKGGFETSSGTDFFATSPASYNDNQWHYAVVTYGGSTVILYIDGVQVASKSTSGASPDSSGTTPVRVAANSRVTPPTTTSLSEILMNDGPGMMTLQQQNRQMHLPARPLTQENRSSTLTFLAAEAEVDTTKHQVLPPQVLTTLMWQLSFFAALII